MAKESQSEDLPQFVRTHGGLLNRLAGRIGLLSPPVSRRFLRLLVLILVTWLPLVLMAWSAGHLTGQTVKIPIWRDAEVHGRFLLALPLLDLTEAFLVIGLGVQVRQFLRSGIISAKERDKFEAARARIEDFHDSTGAELVYFLVSMATSILAHLYGPSNGTSYWGNHSAGMTPAGWWHMLVSLPILYFFLLRAICLLFLWGWFLYRVSKLDLDLTPTHPDHAGGLGFLGWGIASFSPMVVAITIMVSVGFANEIYHKGESLNTLKYHLSIYVLLITFVLHVPVFWFGFQLARCRFEGLLDFGKLVAGHDRSFDEKWIRQPPSRNQDPLLGSSDPLSLAALATTYEHIEEMRLIPIDKKAMLLIVISAIVPLLPLIGTEIPLPEVMSKLAEFLF